jgi:folate-binding protein YgfZ
MIPDVSPESYDAARRHAALVDRSDRGRIVVSGTERASYLQGLFTNDIVALHSGQGCYTAYLTAQGRMIADAWVYELGDVILLALDRSVKDTVLAKLDQFVFSEDVQLGDATETFAQVAVVGPDAPRVVAGVLAGIAPGVLAALADHGNLRADYEGASAIVTRSTDLGEPGFDVFVEAAQGGALKAALVAAGCVAIDRATAEAIRIEAGVPKFHRDMDEDTIPLEAGIESRAISLTKGCYVGQEVIIRVLHRGHGRVVRKLVGLRFAGRATPEAGAVVRAGDRDIGAVTSATRSPALQASIALAYVHRDFIEPDTPVTVDGAAAVVSALPFVPPV